MKTEEDENKENQPIKLKRSQSTEKLFCENKLTSTLRQVRTIIYRTEESQYQIKVSHYLYSWEIPDRYYQMNMDPVKAFLQNNTIRHYNTRIYWNSRYVKWSIRNSNSGIKLNDFG